METDYTGSGAKGLRIIAGILTGLNYVYGFLAICLGLGFAFDSYGDGAEKVLTFLAFLGIGAICILLNCIVRAFVKALATITEAAHIYKKKNELQ